MTGQSQNHTISDTAATLTETASQGEEQRSAEKANPRYIWILELALIAYALYHSVLIIYFTLLSGKNFTAAWDFGWTWVYFLMRCAGALGILGYILYCLRHRAVGLREAPKRSKRNFRLVFELLLVLWVMCAEAVFDSVLFLMAGNTYVEDPANFQWTQPMFRILEQPCVLALLAYVLYMNRSSFFELGLQWMRWDWAMAVPLLCVSSVANAIFSPLVYWAMQPYPIGDTLAAEWRPSLLNHILAFEVPANVLNGFYEELIVRAYLMTVVQRLCPKPLVAICISVGLQVSYHFYQGAPGGLSHSATFAVYAVFYWKTRRILPVILAHTAKNFLNDIGRVSPLHTDWWAAQ